MTKSAKILKIAFVLDSTLDVEDGVQQYILVLGNWLKSKGHEVHYIVGESKRTDITNMHSLARNIKVSFNGNKVTSPLPAKTKPIKDLLNKEKFDILHVQVPYSPFYGAKFVKFSDKKTAVVGTFHILPFGKIAYLGTYLLGICLRRNLQRFDQQISVSCANQAFSAATFKTKSIVIPNMVNFSEFQPPSKFKRNNKKVTLLYLGRLTKRKGCEFLFDALDKIVDEHPNIDFHLNVAGKGELLESLKSKVLNLGLDSQISFLGFVTNQQKVELMRNADISIFPSYSGECFGIVLIEAMAAKSGVVIAGQNPGYASVLGDIPESLVDVKDKKAFSDKIYTMITDKSLKNSVFVAQQKMVGKYDVNVVGQQILEVYKNCKTTKYNG